MTTDHPESAGLMKDIIANPAEDRFRLIYADWLEENDEESRAEFIRCQIVAAKTGQIECQRKKSPGPGGGYNRPVPCGYCDFCRAAKRAWEIHNGPEGGHLFGWDDDGPPFPFAHTCDHRSLDEDPSRDHVTLYLWRGFVESVRCPLAAWCGKPCFCKGRKWDQPAPCHRCHGTLRDGGHGPALVRAHPVARCEIVGAEMGWQPLSRRVWRRESPHWLPGAGGILPHGVFARLRGGLRIDHHNRAYDGEPEALEDLYQAALAWAKAQREPRPPGGPRTFADANDAVDAFYDGTYS